MERENNERERLACGLVIGVDEGEIGIDLLDNHDLVHDLV
jgi:hypothetical protein